MKHVNEKQRRLTLAVSFLNKGLKEVLVSESKSPPLVVSYPELSGQVNKIILFLFHQI